MERYYLARLRVYAPPVIISAKPFLSTHEVFTYFVGMREYIGNHTLYEWGYSFPRNEFVFFGGIS